MWQRVAFAMTVVPLAIGGGVLALFLRGMRAERGAAVGFCLVCTLAVVQACLVASGIAKAHRLDSNLRSACFKGSQAKFSRCLSPWAVCVRGRPAHGSDRGKLRSPSPVRHDHVGRYGVFHCRSVDRAACPHCADKGVKRSREPCCNVSVSLAGSEPASTDDPDWQPLEPETQL